MAHSARWLIGLVVVLLLGLSGCGRKGDPDRDLWTGSPGEIEAHLYARLAQSGCIRSSQEKGEGFALWAAKVDERRLQRVVFKHHDAEGHYDLILAAKTGEIRADSGQRLLHVRLRQAHGVSDGGTTAYYDDRVFSIPF